MNDLDHSWLLLACLNYSEREGDISNYCVVHVLIYKATVILTGAGGGVEAQSFNKTTHKYSITKVTRLLKVLYKSKLNQYNNNRMMFRLLSAAGSLGS